MSEYAIIETGSKQYRVEPKTVLNIEKIALPEGKGKREVTLDKVLFVQTGKSIQVGTPTIKRAKVICEYLGDVRGDKVFNFRFRRRKASRRKIGHRQNYIQLRVKKIEAA